MSEENQVNVNRKHSIFGAPDMKNVSIKIGDVWIQLKQDAYVELVSGINVDTAAALSKAEALINKQADEYKEFRRLVGDLRGLLYEEWGVMFSIKDANEIDNNALHEAILAFDKYFGFK